MSERYHTGVTILKLLTLIFSTVRNLAYEFHRWCGVHGVGSSSAGRPTGSDAGSTGAPEGERASPGPPPPPPHALIVDVRCVQVLLSLRLRMR